MTDAQMFDKYSKELQSIGGVDMYQLSTEDGTVQVFESQSPHAIAVKLMLWSHGASFVSLEIEGIDSGWWNTAEEVDLSFYVEVAKASLQGKVKFNRSPIFKRRECCFKVQKDTWICIPVKHLLTNVTIRKKLNNPIS